MNDSIILRTDYIETLQANLAQYGDGYAAYFATAECIHFIENGELPPWGYYIQQAERVENGSCVFVHRDPKEKVH